MNMLIPARPSLLKHLRLKGAAGRFAATRDEHGVPHIKAERWLDALYGLGYMHAVDRGTQLLFSRSVGAGKAAEEIADQPELLETDRFFRRFGLHRGLTEEVAVLDSKTQAELAAYCEGVNAGLARRGRSLPMWATRYRARTWDPESVMLVGKLLSFGGLAISQLQNERLLVSLIHAGVNEAGLRELFAPRLDNVDFAMLRRVKMANALSDEALELLADLPRLAGSNAWAVSPQRSESGHALLASDPHLEINRLPAIWYEAVLSWDDQYVMGATLPGCPLFAVARTSEVAWGVTYMKGDAVDYFVEDCRPAPGGGWQYRRARHWRDYTIREETIGRKGGEAQTLHVYENEQGVLETDPDQHGPGLHLAVAWTGNHVGSGRAIAAWLDVIAARWAAEAMDIVRDCPQPTLCWVFADRQGHIGLQGCGRIPQRGTNQIGLAPTPAWRRESHWQGWLPVELLPRKYDPPEGFLGTANEEVNPPGELLLCTQPLGDYRKRRIDNRLHELPQATIEDMCRLQYDLYSTQAEDLLEIFLPHLPDGEVKERLERWDRCYSADSLEASLYQRLYRNVLIETFGHERGLGWRRMLYLSSRAGYSMMVLTAADRLLAKEDSVWWRGRDKGQLIRRACERLEEQSDRQPEQPWSEVNNFHFTDRFFGAHRVGHILGFNSGKHPMPGCHATPFQGHVVQTATRETTFAPSYHFVTDLGTDEAWTNLPGGPSESRFSRYYKSDVPRWLTGDYKRLADLTLDVANSTP
ncbi:MAG: penicillin acylase family protein [Planctomycetes bacterium]|nr:penicillin acylase family protein [Planctomycetota bacterium]